VKSDRGWGGAMESPLLYGALLCDVLVDGVLGI
jgi:hypothetical protein